jgi:CRP-like cAMP-binding protein
MATSEQLAMCSNSSDLTARKLRPGILIRPRNQLLEALSSQGRDILGPYLKPVFLKTREVLIDADEPLTRFYFPQGSAVVSMMRLFQDGRVSEMATVGNDGVVPLGAPLSEGISFARCVVQIAGPAVTLDAARLQNAVREHPTIGRLLTAFTTTLLSQVLQSAACNAVHSAEQRCARWLLTAMDRSGSDCLALTHEFMAEMLGVHRPTVSVVARSLQQAGMIRYRRGAITIVDRLRLEQAACECYLLDNVGRGRFEAQLRDLLAAESHLNYQRGGVDHARTPFFSA